MAKKKEIIETVAHNVDWNLEDIMSDRFGRYSKYIIQERALPDARDGLKPVQRRILFAMDKDGNTYEKAHRKSAKTVGLVIGTYHPHGDTSVYDAMVRMSQDWKVNVPLIDMHGNNGSIDNDPAAAMRYTEARLSKSAGYLLEDIDYNTVPMTNNYDDTELEPTVLPVAFPLLLVNGATGIASGYATNIAPHNMGEVIDGTIYRILNPNCSIEDLEMFIKGPDFPTGGIVQGKKEIDHIFKTGKGRVIVRSKAIIKEAKTVNQIIISEIPYEVIKCDLVKQIAIIRLDKSIDGIVDVRDESDRNGLLIVVDIKKDVDANLILNYLYKNTSLQISYTYNMIAIMDHRPVLMTLDKCLDAFISFRKEVVINRTKFLLEQKKKRIHILDGLMKAISILDDIIELIKSSKDKADSKRKICDAFLFSDVQAEAIVTMRLYRLSNTDITALREEYVNLNREINELETILSVEDVLHHVIINELKAIKENNPTPRRSLIENEIEEIVIDKKAMISAEDCYISLTHDGYLRRYSERIYSSNAETFPYCKEGDQIIGISKANSLDTLLIFLDNGEYACLPVHEIEDTKWKDIGSHYSSLVKGSHGHIVSAMIVNDFSTGASVITISKNGMIKKTMINEFALNRYSKTAVAMKLKDNDELIKALVSYDEEEILLVSKDGYYNRYSSLVLNPLAPKAMGVKAINVKGDEVVDAILIQNLNDDLLIRAATSFKRLHLKDLVLTSRATKGNRLFKQRKSNPYIVNNIYEVNNSSTYYVMNEERTILEAKDVSLLGIDATFAKALDYNDDYYLLSSNNSEIETVKIIPMITKKEIASYGQMELFEDE